MNEEELREKVQWIVCGGDMNWPHYPREEKDRIRGIAYRAIAVCREHYEAEIARLTRERDAARGAVSRASTINITKRMQNRHRRKEKPE